MDIRMIPTLFGLPEASGLTELSAGHINQTFLAVCGGEKYILQAVNSSVFHAPEVLMDNIDRIEAAFAASAVTETAVPHFIAAGDKKYAAANEKLWRMYKYIVAAAKAPANAGAAGRLFGTFIRIMDGRTLSPTPAIDGFHDFDRYFAALAEKKGTDPSIMAKLDRLRETVDNIFTSPLKKRIIHGDAKPDNIILSDIPAIIDLDTVMYGYAAIDYGDLVRSVCRGKGADLPEIRNVTRGFAAGLDGTLGTDEVKSLYYGILWLTGELAVRYLNDSLSDEKYFRGKSSADCRSRGEELLRQLDEFTACGDEIMDIINDAFAV